MTAALTLAVAVVLRLVDPWFVGELRERTFDLYQRMAPRAFVDVPVRVVDIDEASLAELGQWPWPRTRMAALVERLRALGAKVIAFDVLFAEPDRSSPLNIARELQRERGFSLAGADNARAQLFAALSELPDHDQAFVAAIRRVPVVTTFAALPSKNAKRPPVKVGFAVAGAAPAAVLSPFAGAAINLPAIDEVASGIGAASLSSDDRSGTIRRAPMLLSDGDRIYPAFALEAVRVMQEQSTVVTRGTGASGVADNGQPALLAIGVGTLQVPLTRNGELWIYYGRETPERYLSARDVLDAAMDATIRPRIAGRLIFVGTSAAGLLDSRFTALGEYVPGVSIHAQIAEQILAQTYLSRPDWADGAEIVAMVALGCLLALLLRRFGAGFALVSGSLVIGAGIAVSWLAYSFGNLLLDPVYPSIGAGAACFAVTSVMYFAADRERKFIRHAFGQYVAPELLARIERSPELLRLGGEVRRVTVMFVDVREFSPIVEALAAEEVVHFVNRLMSPLADAIQSELGTLDKFVGDGIMAMWNAPLDIPDHAVRACHAALRMRAIVAELNTADAFGFRARALPNPDVRIRIGINTGQACVGNLGSETRFNYSAVGDAVNVAARLEASAGSVGVDILISAETASAAPDFAVLEAGEIALKGLSRPVPVATLIGGPETKTGAPFAELAAAHDRLLAALRARDMLAARSALEGCRKLNGGELGDFYREFERRVGEMRERVEVA